MVVHTLACLVGQRKDAGHLDKVEMVHHTEDTLDMDKQCSAADSKELQTVALGYMDHHKEDMVHADTLMEVELMLPEIVLHTSNVLPDTEVNTEMAVLQTYSYRRLA